MSTTELLNIDQNLKNIVSKQQLDKIKAIPLIETLKLQKIDDDEYFSEKYNGYISNSRLNLLNPNQGGSPEQFFEGFAKHAIYSDSLNIGSAVHELVLQSDTFKLAPMLYRPTAKLGFVCDELYKVYIANDTVITDEDIIKASDKIDYYKDKLNDDRIKAIRNAGKIYWKKRSEYEMRQRICSDNVTSIILDEKSREKVVNSVKALNDNAKIQELLHPVGLINDPISENEQAILLDVKIEIQGKEPFILKLKAKLDNYTIDTETDTLVINDVKTIGKSVYEFEDNVRKFRYMREMAIYSWLLSLAAKKYYNMPTHKIRSNFLVVSTNSSYYTKIVPMTLDWYREGWNEFRWLLRLAAYWYDKGYKFE